MKQACDSLCNEFFNKSLHVQYLKLEAFSARIAFLYVSWQVFLCEVSKCLRSSEAFMSSKHLALDSTEISHKRINPAKMRA